MLKTDIASDKKEAENENKQTKKKIILISKA